MAGADGQTNSLRDWITSPVGAVVAAVVTIAIVAFVALSGGDDEEKPASTTQTVNPPSPVKAPELAALSESLGQPVYWAGARGAREFELTRQGQERITVRYPAAGGGSAEQGTLTVATYRLDDAMAAVRRAGRAGPTTTLHKLPKRGLAVSDSARPTNVYVAYGDEPYQVEVYDPKPGRALKLVLAGKVRPVR